MRTLYVGGLPPEADEEHLRTVFEPFGPVGAARVIMRSSTGTCRGFGYVTFDDEAHALRAMQELDGEVVRGSKWRVHVAK